MRGIVAPEATPIPPSITALKVPHEKRGKKKQQSFLSVEIPLEKSWLFNFRLCPYTVQFWASWKQIGIPINSVLLHWTTHPSLNNVWWILMVNILMTEWLLGNEITIVDKCVEYKFISWFVRNAAAGINAVSAFQFSTDFLFSFVIKLNYWVL